MSSIVPNGYNNINPCFIGMKIEPLFLHLAKEPCCLNPYSTGMKIEPSLGVVIRVDVKS